MAGSTCCRSRTTTPACWSPTTASSSSVSPAASAVGLGHQEPRRKEESRPRTGRQCRRHRPQRRRPRICRRALREPEASATPDRPASRCSAFWSSSRSMENSSTCFWSRSEEAEEWRSAGRIHRRRPAHPRERCHPHHGMDRRSRPRRSAPTVRWRSQGLVVEPTVLTGTRPDMKVNCQEIFGPVVTVEPYDEFDEALRQINNSPYGLQAGIFTRDAKLMFQAFEELEVGGLHRRRCTDVPHRPHALRRRQRFRHRPRRPAVRDRRNDRTQTHGNESALSGREPRWEVETLIRLASSPCSALAIEEIDQLIKISAVVNLSQRFSQDFHFSKFVLASNSKNPRQTPQSIYNLQFHRQLRKSVGGFL